MTIFHSDKFVDRSSIETLTATSSEPDAIGYEATAEGKELFSIYFEVDGRRTIRFGAIDDFEFEVGEFRNLINEGVDRLIAWDADLRRPGGTWAGETQN